MKTSKLVPAGKVLAAVVIVLGIIHDIATFTPLISEGLACLNPADLNAVIFMSLACGSSFILCGIVLFLLFSKIDQYTFLVTPVIIIGAFLGISGVLAVFYMPDNPFAWISFLANGSIFILTLMFKFKMKPAV